MKAILNPRLHLAGHGEVCAIWLIDSDEDVRIELDEHFNVLKVFTRSESSGDLFKVIRNWADGGDFTRGTCEIGSMQETLRRIAMYLITENEAKHD